MTGSKVDFTVIFPFDYDSFERSRNLLKNFAVFTNVLPGGKFIVSSHNEGTIDSFKQDLEVYEIASKMKFHPTFLISDCYWHNTIPLFWKTRLINNAIKYVFDNADFKNLQVIAVIDVDLLFGYHDYHAAFDRAINNPDEIIFSYGGTTYECQPEIRTVNPATLDALEKYVCYSTGSASVGGSYWFNICRFIEVGGMNEEMVSWGFEDNEFFERVSRLGKIYRTKGAAYHMPHPRHINSSDANPKIHDNKNIYETMTKCSEEDLKAYASRLRQQFASTEKTYSVLS